MHWVRSACLNALTLFGWVFGLYRYVCHEMPSLPLSELRETWNHNVAHFVLELQHVCHQIPSVSTECWNRVGMDGLVLALILFGVLNFHRMRSRVLLIGMLIGWTGFHSPIVQQFIAPKPRVKVLEPVYALVNEPLMISIMGDLLKPRSSIAWVPYWGCASTSSVHDCDKQYESEFQAGVVTVTFSAVDDYIVCYKDPPNPSLSPEYECFEQIRLRVKDRKSFPGWSEHDEL